MAKISGNKLNNILVGTVNNDIIKGFDGNDYLIGYNGDDQLYGGNGQDVLKGGDGYDVLDGGKGADIMVGGTGDDSYHIDNGNDTVVELVENDSFDAVTSEINYILPANVEGLKLVGSHSFKGIGNELDNTITGNLLNNTLIGLDGNDKLDGGKGSDIMMGGKGDDIYFVDNKKDSIMGENEDKNQWPKFGDSIFSRISYTLPKHVESLSLEGNGNLNGFGNDLDNGLTGNNGNNWLLGGDGNDTFQGGDGSDILIGGIGNDTLEGDYPQFIGAPIPSFNNVMRGGLGHDFYIVNSKNDVVIESTAITGGIDTVSSIFNYTLPKGVEYLFLNLWEDVDRNIFGATEGNGNQLDNKIEGNELDNTLRGFDGNDILFGGDRDTFRTSGHDILFGGNGNDILNGQDGDDKLFGGNGDDLLISNDDTGYSDFLSGDNGNDTLVCVLDYFHRLIGGSGQDTFSFDMNSLPITTGYFVEISDFKSGLDIIDLGPIAISSGHFLSYIGNAAFSSSNASGQVRFDAANHQLLGSTDISAEPEFTINLLGINHLTADDIILK